MRMGDTDFSELTDLGGYGNYSGAGRWGSAHGGSSWGRSAPPHHGSATHAATSSFQHAARNSFEAEDAQYTSNRSGGGSRGRPGLYYSPPGTSYTIVERPASASRPHTPHSYYGGKLNPRGTYLGSSTVISGSTSNFPSANAAGGTSYSVTNSTRHTASGGGVGANKKRPISPEQVLRLFGPQGSGAGARAGSAGAGRRTGPSPASSPPSTTHQAGYRERPVQHSVPNIHELCTRTVAMSRDPPDGSHGFGICVKGGKDAGVGVYISRVEEGSVAERAGLRPGDSILEVNGTPFTAISHEEALKQCVQMLKSCRQLSMTVRSPTLPPQGIPGQNINNLNATGGGYLMRQTCSWMDRQGRPVSPPMEYSRPSTRYPQRDRSVRRVDLCIEPGQSLGLMIRGGAEYSLGIYITGVDKDSVADRAGLLIGDQILEVNGQSFMDVTHDEAVSQLKFHKRMSLLVRDVGKVPHSCTAYDREPWDPASPTSRVPRRSAAQQMVEEKARTLLPRSEFSALCYYTQEYCARNMTCEALVTVMMEMFNTPEKLTLLTELREIIFSEDLVRFDELVYRRDIHPHQPHGHAHVDGHIDATGGRIHSRRKMDGHAGGHHDLSGDGGGGPYSDVMDDQGRSPSEDSGLGLAVQDRQSRTPHRSSGWAPRPTTSDLALSNDEEQEALVQDFGDEDIAAGRGSRRHSSPGESREGSHTALHTTDYEDSMITCGYLDGLRSHLGGWTQRVKSWYWGRPLELAHKLSRSFDMKEDSSLLADGAAGPVRRHQSMSRLPPATPEPSTAPRAVPDQQGNLHVTVKKSKPILGIAIEGGANTKHPLPRIINIHEHGAAFSAGGLEVGQLILEVDGRSVEGMPHQDVARLIAECFARRDNPDISFVVVEAKKSNLEPKPTALIFLEA